jgi:hypothetical protein
LTNLISGTSDKSKNPFAEKMDFLINQGYGPKGFFGKQDDELAII